MLFIICAPSGAGKTSLIKEIFKYFPFLRFSVSATTRKKRKGEQNGIDYFFITKKDFEKKIKNNEFVEWEVVHGENYGTLKSEIDKALKDNYDIIFDIDVKGALSIKKLYPEAITVFIDAPKTDIISRLKKRKTESAGDIKKRIERMEMELSLRNKIDYSITNESKPWGFEKAVKDLIKLISKFIKNEI